MKHQRFAIGIASAFEGMAGSLAATVLSARLAGERMQPVVAARLRHSVAADFHKFMDSAEILASEFGTAAAPLITNLKNIAQDTAEQALRRARGMDIKKAFVTEPEGAMRDLLRRSQVKVEFTAKDSAGRTWQANKLVRFLARDFAYQQGVDKAAQDLAQQGDLAQVSYLDPSHVNHGMVVSLTGKPGYPSYESIRDTIFHPNSSAQLTHVHPQ